MKSIHSCCRRNGSWKDCRIRFGSGYLRPSPGLLKNVDIIKPNETELSALAGRTLDGREDLINAAKVLIHKGVSNVIATLGGQGVLFVNHDTEQFFEAGKVQAVDTTAAGDSFTAALKRNENGKMN